MIEPTTRGARDHDEVLTGAALRHTVRPSTQSTRGPSAAQNCDHAAPGPFALLRTDVREVLIMPVDAGPQIAGPANLKEVRCTAMRKFRQGGRDRRDVECRGILKEIPRQKPQPALVAIADRSAASGDSEVKRCERCGQWWELREPA